MEISTNSHPKFQVKIRCNIIAKHQEYLRVPLTTLPLDKSYTQQQKNTRNIMFTEYKAVKILTFLIRSSILPK